MPTRRFDDILPGYTEEVRKQQKLQFEADRNKRIWEEKKKEKLETLRDQVAVAALQGILAHDGAYGFGSGPGDITKRSFDFADTFIAEKKRRDESENR
jgi:hypothetical protein